MIRFAVGLAGVLLIACRSLPPVDPQEIDYPSLFRAANASGRNIALTIQKGASVHPVSTKDGLLIYSSSRDGSSDIWIRDMKNTVVLSIVRHPAEQTTPAVPLDGSKLAFVSYDSDSGGDLRLSPMNTNEMIQGSLVGASPPNLWDTSVNLSEQIDKLAEGMPAECRGSFAEADPIFSSDGKKLFFTTDRCTRGLFNLWVMELDALKPIAMIPLTTAGALQPSLSLNGQRLAFLSYRSNPRGDLFVLDIPSRKEIKIETGRRTPGVLQFPALSPDGSVIFYSAIREDTNHNGTLDALDNAGIYSVPVIPYTKMESRLLEPARSLHGLAFSSFLGGSLLYSAEAYQDVNIFLLRPEGVVPRQADIDEQFAYAQKYGRDKQRRLVALEALVRFYSESKEYLYFEGRVIMSRLELLTGEEKTEAESELETSRKANAFTDLVIQLANLPRAKVRSEFISNFNKQLKVDPNPERMKMLEAGILDELSKALESEGKKREALEALHKLNTEHPTYYRRTKTAVREAVLSLKVDGAPSDMILAEIAKSPPARKDELLNEVYNFYIKIKKPAEIDSAVSTQLERKEIEPLRATLNLVKAKSLYDRGRDSEARQILDAMETAFPPDSGMYVRRLQILALVYERQRDFDRAYDARLRYGGAYRPDTGVRIGIEEYREILDQSDKNVRRTLGAARSIAAYVDEADRLVSSSLVGRTISGTPVETLLNAAQEKPIELSGGDRQVLREVCAPQGRHSGLVFSLGKPEYLKTFQKFCTNGNPYFTGETDIGLKLDEARTAADILYIISYAEVNIINILFYNMKKVNLFESFHAEKSIEYHRWKIDIAMERNRVGIEWDRKKVQILDPRNVVQLFSNEGDPFEATAFNEIMHGYKFASPEARQVGDMTFLYGYAYALIQKTAEREAFYDRLNSEGVVIPEDIRRGKKQDSLRDLKTAEYLLQYVLFVSPDNADAYLLLGWMYQFIDDRRARNVPSPENFLIRMVNFVTSIPPGKSTDGRYFGEIYRTYFPDRLYENNVYLYGQAIRLISQAKPSEPALADLHLNLGNNLFQLLNFKKSIEHYNKSEALRKNLAGGQDLTRQILFYVNRGRAYYYEGETAFAAPDLKKAIDLYTTYELKPIEQKLESIKYNLSDETETADARNKLKVRLDESQEKLDAARLKVALVASLYGLALWESGDYTESAKAYDLAGEQLRRMEEKESALEASVLNFLALTRQDQSRIKDSDASASLSEKMTNEIGLKRNDDKYRPQSIGGQLLGCFLPYGEDFSVIGDGRNPYGFSPLRQHELSMGIRLENRILEGDRAGALAVLEERKELFAKKDGDVKLGSVGILTANNQKAYEEFQSGHLKSAEGLFQTTAEDARNKGYLDQARRNYRNRFQTLFAQFESNPHEATVSRVDGAMKDFAAFRDDYRVKEKEEFIRQQLLEDPEFAYDPERDDAILQAQLARKLSDFAMVEGSLYFYRGEAAERQANSKTEIDSARKDYQKALELYEVARKSRPAEPDSAQFFRVKLNTIATQIRLGKIDRSIQQLPELIDELDHFLLFREVWHARLILARAAMQRYKDRGSPADLAIASQEYRAAATLLKEEPQIRPSIGSLMEDFYKEACVFALDQKDFLFALTLMTDQRDHRLQDGYLRYPLSFAHAPEAEEYARYLDAYKDLYSKHEVDQSLRFARADFKKAQAQRLGAKTAFVAAGVKLAARIPLHKSFILPSNIEPNLPANTWLIRLFFQEGKQAAFLSGPGFRVFQDAGGEVTAGLERIFAWLPRALPREIFLIADEGSYPADIEGILARVRPDLPAPIFVTSPSDRMLAYSQDDPQLNQFNYYDRTDRADFSDILPITEDFADDFFAIEKHRFNARAQLQAPGFASAVFSSVSYGPNRYQKDMFGYEVARASGAASFLVPIPESKAVPTNVDGIGRLTGHGYRVFGYPGFDALFIAAGAKLRREEALRRARALEKSGDFTSAANHYRLASSLSWTLGDKSQFLQHTLSASRTRMQANPAAGEKTYASLLADKTFDRNARFRIYNEFFTSRFRLGQFEKAEEIAREWGSEFPDKTAYVQRRIQVVTFLKRLEGSDAVKYFSDPDKLASEFNELFSDLSAKETAPAVMDLLISRGLLAEANRIAAAQSDLSKFEWIKRIAAHQSLLYGNLPDDPLSEFVDSDEPGLNQASASIGRIKRGDALDSGELSQTFPKTNSSLMQSVLFNLYLDSSDSDPGFLSARLMRDMLAEMRKSMPERAAMLALATSERFLAYGHCSVASRALRFAQEVGKDSVASVERMKREAEVGLTLSFCTGVNDSNVKRYSETLSEDDVRVKLRPALPASANPEEIRTFMAAARPYLQPRSAGQAPVLAAVRNLKAKALKEKAYAVALDLSFLEDRIQYLPAGAQFENRTAQIVQRLPKDQQFTALIESENRLHRIRISGGIIEHDQWDKSSREIRAGVARSIAAASQGTDVSRMIRAMAAGKTNQVNYLYLPATMSLAAPNLELGDRIFVVPSPDPLFANAPYANGDEFEPGFKIFAAGVKRPTFADPEDRVWQERLIRMEELLVRPRSPDKSAIVHIFDRRYASEKSASVWFYSAMPPARTLKERVFQYGLDMYLLSRNYSRPGIFYCDTGQGHSALRFMRHYYDSESEVSSMPERYQDTQVLIKRENVSPLNLRIVTPAFIVDKKFEVPPH